MNNERPAMYIKIGETAISSRLLARIKVSA